MSFPCSQCDNFTAETLAELYSHIALKHPSAPKPTDKEPPKGTKPWNPKRKR